MNTNWWLLVIVCGGCNQPAPLHDFRFSADGELLFIGRCDTCKAMVHLTVYASKLSHIALRQDMDKADKPKAQTPVRPPLAISPPTFTEQDKKYLHEMGAGDEEAA